MVLRMISPSLLLNVLTDQTGDVITPNRQLRDRKNLGAEKETGSFLLWEEWSECSFSNCRDHFAVKKYALSNCRPYQRTLKIR